MKYDGPVSLSLEDDPDLVGHMISPPEAKRQKLQHVVTD